MRQFILAGVILAVTLTPGMGRTQEDAPWPPDPTAIFAAGVEIVDTELVEEVDTSPVVDNEARVIRVYDGEWREFPFPNEVQEIFGVTTRSDGTLFVNLVEYAFEPNERLILDPTTGIYVEPEALCDKRIRALPGEGHWYFYVSPDTSRVHLCFTETGEISAPLPEDVGWRPSDNLPNLSPNGRWVALMGFTGDYPNSCVVIFSYELATSVLNNLGCINNDGFEEENSFLGWISDTQGSFIHGFFQESLGDNLYAFNVTQPASLEFAFPGWYSYRFDPPRYVYLQTHYFVENKTGASSSHHIPCVLHTYDAEGIDWFELGYDCIGLTRVDDGYFYVRFDSNPASISTLVHLNRSTGELTDLFTEEIETLRSISPDGRYVVLWLGNNGQVERVDRGDSEYDLLLPDRTIRAAIFDTTTRDIVYQSDTFMGILQWLTPETALAAHVSAENPPGVPVPESYSLITLDEEVSEIRIEDGGFIRFSSYLLSSDGQRSVGYSDSGGSAINLATSRVTPIFYISNSELYEIEIEWEDSDLLSIIIHPIVDYRTDPTRTATYTVRIP